MPAAAPVSAKADHAVVLLFVDQTVTVGADAPTNTTSSVRVTLDKVGGRWLISAFDPIYHPMPAPRWIDVAAPAVQLRALTWGPDDGPIALCLHGFPDTAYGFRKLAPHLVAAGYRVVAPFMRGYVPSSIPSDGSYHIGALMHDALQVREACGPTDRDVVIGHDWGAAIATGLAAMPDSPFVKAVVMSVPPSAALRPQRGPVPNRGKLLRLLPAQLCAQLVHQLLPAAELPERSGSWIVPLLWRRWSPGYNAAEDLRHVDAAIGAPQYWRAALGPYRATIRNTKPPARYAELHRWWTEPPQLPTPLPARQRRRLHDTGIHALARDALPDGSDVAIVENAGHFLQLEQPGKVAELGAELHRLGRLSTAVVSHLTWGPTRARGPRRFDLRLSPQVSCLVGVRYGVSGVSRDLGSVLVAESQTPTVSPDRHPGHTGTHHPGELKREVVALCLRTRRRRVTPRDRGTSSTPPTWCSAGSPLRQPLCCAASTSRHSRRMSTVAISSSSSTPTRSPSAATS